MYLPSFSPQGTWLPPHDEVSQPQAARSSLPIARHRDQVLYLVETHATTVVVGETGSGAHFAGILCRADVIMKR